MRHCKATLPQLRQYQAQLEGATIVLGISVGNENTSGDKFRSLINTLIRDQRY